MDVSNPSSPETVVLVPKTGLREQLPNNGTHSHCAWVDYQVARGADNIIAFVGKPDSFNVGIDAVDAQVLYNILGANITDDAL
jgi:hypothetical protein